MMHSLLHLVDQTFHTHLEGHHENDVDIDEQEDILEPLDQSNSHSENATHLPSFNQILQSLVDFSINEPDAIKQSIERIINRPKQSLIDCSLIVDAVHDQPINQASNSRTLPLSSSRSAAATALSNHQLLSFQLTALSRSLTIIKPSSTRSIDQSINQSNDQSICQSNDHLHHSNPAWKRAKLMFTQIRACMERDQSNSQLPEHSVNQSIVSIIKSCIQFDCLINEYFAQLVKQMTNNPSSSSNQMAVKLVLIGLIYFKPADQLIDIVMTNMNEFTPKPYSISQSNNQSSDQSISSYTPANCVILIHSVLCLRERNQMIVPTILSIQEAEHFMNSCEIRSVPVSRRTSLTGQSNNQSSNQTNNQTNNPLFTQSISEAANRSSIVFGDNPLFASLLNKRPSLSQSRTGSLNQSNNPFINLSNNARSSIVFGSNPLFGATMSRNGSLRSSFEQSLISTVSPMESSSHTPTNTSRSIHLNDQSVNQSDYFNSVNMHQPYVSRCYMPNEIDGSLMDYYFVDQVCDSTFEPVVRSSGVSSPMIRTCGTPLIDFDRRSLWADADVALLFARFLDKSSTSDQPILSNIPVPSHVPVNTQSDDSAIPCPPPLAPALDNHATHPSCDAPPEAPPIAPALFDSAPTAPPMAPPIAPSFSSIPAAPPMAPPLAIVSTDNQTDECFVCSRCKQAENPHDPPQFDPPCAPSLDGVPLPPSLDGVPLPPPFAPSFDGIPPPPPPAIGAPKPRNDIMATIKAAQAKKAGSSNTQPADPRSAMLDQIRNGPKLRKTAAPNDSPPDAPLQSTNPRDALLDAIRNGPKLKKVGASVSSTDQSDLPPSSPSTGNPRDDLLAAIRNGPRLRKVHNDSPAPASASVSSSANSRDDMLAAIRAGPRLRKVGDQSNDGSSAQPPPVAPKPVADPREDLLAAIRNGPKLRKVGATTEVSAAAAAKSVDPRNDLLAAIRAGPKLRDMTTTVPESSDEWSTDDSIPAPPLAPAFKPASDPRDDMLAAIRNGPKLRKVAVQNSQVASSGDPRNDLLASIRSGPKLRHVIADNDIPAPPPILGDSGASASAPPMAPAFKPAASDPRDNMLAAIRNGPKLRKTADQIKPPSSTGDPRNDLLASIRSGPKLRHVSTEALHHDVPVPPPIVGDTGVPEPPAAPTFSSSSNPRDDMLAAIRNGPKLRKVADQNSSSTSSSDPRNDLLASIRSGPKLRHVIADNDISVPPPILDDSGASAPPMAPAFKPAASDPRDDVLAAIRNGPKLRKVADQIKPPSSSGDPRNDLLAAIRTGPRLRHSTDNVPVAPSSGDPRDDLLAAIRSGPKLKKVTDPSTSTVADARDDLLSAIRAGPRLKHVEKPEKRDSVTIPHSAPIMIPSGSDEPINTSIPMSATKKPFRRPSKLSTSAPNVNKMTMRSALSTMLQRRNSRMKYDTIKPGQISPLADSLTSSPTHHQGRSPSVSQTLNSELESEVLSLSLSLPSDRLVDDFQSQNSSSSSPLSSHSALPTIGEDVMDHSKPAESSAASPDCPDAPPIDLQVVPPPAPPMASNTGPRNDIQASIKAAQAKRAALEASGMDPRNELLNAIQGGARLRKVSVSHVTHPVAHSRSPSILDHVVAAASQQFHGRMQSISIAPSSNVIRPYSPASVAPVAPVTQAASSSSPSHTRSPTLSIFPHSVTPVTPPLLVSGHSHNHASPAVVESVQKKPDWMLALKATKQPIKATITHSHEQPVESELSRKLKVRAAIVKDNEHQMAGATSELAAMLVRRQQKLVENETTKT